MAAVARIWRGVIRTEDRDAYAAYLAETGIKEYRQTPGNQGAYILTRDLGGGIFFQSTTLIGPAGNFSMTWRRMRALWRISSTRTR